MGGCSSTVCHGVTLALSRTISCFLLTSCGLLFDFKLIQLPFSKISMSMLPNPFTNYFLAACLAVCPPGHPGTSVSSQGPQAPLALPSLRLPWGGGAGTTAGATSQAPESLCSLGIKCLYYLDYPLMRSCHERSLSCTSAEHAHHSPHSTTVYSSFST